MVATRQQNQKKTLSDFESEPYEIIEDEDSDYPYRELVCILHHLTRTLEYQETRTKDFNRWIVSEEERENNLCDAERLSAVLSSMLIIQPSPIPVMKILRPFASWSYL